MSRRRVRRLYERACAEYREGAVAYIRNPGSSPTTNFYTYAYCAGWEDAKAGDLQDAIRIDTWVNVLALEFKHWAFRHSRHR